MVFKNERAVFIVGSSVVREIDLGVIEIRRWRWRKALAAIFLVDQLEYARIFNRPRIR